MEISTTLNQSQAITALNSQQPPEARRREQDGGVGSSQDTPSTNAGPSGTQVSLSSEALRLANDGLDPAVNRNSVNQTSETTNEPRRSDADRSAEILAGSAKSVSQAISAYREASVI